jgi:hypothetical protein
MNTQRFVAGSAALGLVPALCAAMAAGCSGGPPASGASVTRRYTIAREKALDGTQFTERDTIALTITSAGQDYAFQVDADPPIRARRDANGDFDPDADVPLIARILLAATPPPGAAPAAGSRWEARWPSDARVAAQDDNLGIQALHAHEVRGVRDEAGRRLLDLSVTGQMRLLDNQRMRALLVLGTDAESLAAESSLRKLAAWNFYLVGSMEWNEAKAAVSSADLTLSAIPAVRPTSSELLGSVVRNHLTIRLQS